MKNLVKFLIVFGLLGLVHNHEWMVSEVRELAPLQRVISAAARFVANLRPRDHVSHVLRDLHWLPSASENHTRCASLCSKSSMDLRRHTWLAWSRAFPIFQVGVISVLPQRDCLTCLALELCLVPGLSQSLAHWPGMVSLPMFEPFATLSHLNQHSKLTFFN